MSLQARIVSQATKADKLMMQEIDAIDRKELTNGSHSINFSPVFKIESIGLPLLCVEVMITFQNCSYSSAHNLG